MSDVLTTKPMVQRGTAKERPELEFQECSGYVGRECSGGRVVMFKAVEPAMTRLSRRSEAQFGCFSGSDSACGDLERCQVLTTTPHCMPSLTSFALTASCTKPSIVGRAM